MPVCRGPLRRGPEYRGIKLNRAALATHRPASSAMGMSKSGFRSLRLGGEKRAILCGADANAAAAAEDSDNAIARVC